MKLLGRVQEGADEFWLYVTDAAKTVTWYLVSSRSKRDLFSESNVYLDPVINSVSSLSRNCTYDYVLGAIKRTKVSGKVSVFGNYKLLERIIRNMSALELYHFAKNEIREDRTFTLFDEVHKEFHAETSRVFYKTEMVNNLMKELTFSYEGMTVELHSSNAVVHVGKPEFKEAPKQDAKNVLISTLPTITKDILATLIDLSWYEKDGKKLKHYLSIHSIKEFELDVMRPLLLAIEQAELEQKKLVVSCDTETTGLNIFNLSKDNEDKDHCVTIQLSWEDDQGVIIYLDMEHFSNVDTAYVAKRLTTLFSPAFKTKNWETGEELPRELLVYKEEELEVDGELHAFGGEEEESTNTQLVPDHVVRFFRSSIILVGHNVMFDGKTAIDCDADFMFDEDTLQMAFCLNPKVVRGSVALKNLTHRLLHHDTPELSTILGKGNEDKFRQLVDEEVVRIYGCADTDYTRKLYFVLKALMTPKLYAAYKKQDTLMFYILQRSEYFGLNTDQDKLITQAKQTEQDLQQLKEFLYCYVGSVISFKKKIEALNRELDAGLITKAEYDKKKAETSPDPGARYEFEMKASQLRDVLYNILGYPIKAYTDGKNRLPKVDKYVMQKLIADKYTKEQAAKRRVLTDDLISTSITRAEYNDLIAKGKKKLAKSYCLISKDDINRCKFPIALVLQKYSELNKEYTSYYKPILEQNLEGKICKSYSLARIETRRIMNAVQTMKGSLKALVRAYSDDYYLLDFDMSQAEYRIMVSLAHYTKMIIKMKDPENDYHTETAALVYSIMPHLVSKKVRKSCKSISFGVPYGLGLRSLCEKVFGSITQENLESTEALLLRWTSNNGPIMEMLTDARNKAFVEWHMSNELRDFMDAWRKDDNGYVLDERGERIPIPMSKIENELGFYRVFDLTGQDLSEEAVARRMKGKFNGIEGKISRPAGNYMIQAYAAELFRLILMRFYMRCEQEGINDKIIWHMLIHDELLASVHKSINPFYLYKLVKESCMVNLKGHTNYFVGINIGKTWGECKDDAKEAPVYFVDRMIKRFDAGEFPKFGWYDDPWEYIKPYRMQYNEDRIGEVVAQIYPTIGKEPVDMRKLMDRFGNYTVRAMVSDYKKAYDVPEAADESEYETTTEGDRKWCASFETWYKDVYGEDALVVDYDTGKVRKVCDKQYKIDEDHKEIVDHDYIDYDLLFEDEDDEMESERASYWSFDGDSVDTTNYIDYEELLSEDDLRDQQNQEFLAEVAVATVTKKTTKYKHLTVSPRQILIDYRHPSDVAKIKQKLNPYAAPIGLSVAFRNKLGQIERYVKVKEIINLKELDDFVDQLFQQ